jgi:hypothetical protein
MDKGIFVYTGLLIGLCMGCWFIGYTTALKECKPVETIKVVRDTTIVRDFIFPCKPEGSKFKNNKLK